MCNLQTPKNNALAVTQSLVELWLTYIHLVCSFLDIADMFCAARCKHIDRSHWTDDSSWEMVDALDAVLVEELKHRVNASPVIALTIDDSNAYDLT